MDDLGQFSKAARLLVVGASFVVVVAGMRAASEILTPLLLAVFIALLCLPVVRWLHRKRVPDSVAVPTVLLLTVLVLVSLISVLTGSMAQFVSDGPKFVKMYHDKEEQVVDWLEDRLDRRFPHREPYREDERGETKKPDAPEDDSEQSLGLLESIDASKVFEFFQGAIGQFSAILSNLFLIILLVVFLLFELLGLPRKIALAQPDRESKGEFERIVRSVNQYITIKTLVSTGTGILAGVLCKIVGVWYPVLWGMAAFMLNFIPNIGSILAAVPPVLLAFILPGLGVGSALTVAGGFVGINVLIGNVIEPRLMGRSLDLSTLVVFVSMVFWGWVFGAVGMFLSVPLTMVLKISLESSEATRPFAILLGAAPDPE
jgi:predicted PurR-regulated permease PerM